MAFGRSCLDVSCGVVCCAFLVLCANEVLCVHVVLCAHVVLCWCAHVVLCWCEHVSVGCFFSSLLFYLLLFSSPLFSSLFSPSLLLFVCLISSYMSLSLFFFSFLFSPLSFLSLSLSLRTQRRHEPDKCAHQLRTMHHAIHWIKRELSICQSLLSHPGKFSRVGSN